MKETAERLTPLIAQFLALHVHTITPETHARLLQLQAQLEKLSYTLSLEDGALTMPLHEWQGVRHFAAAKYAQAANDSIAKSASTSLYEYLQKLADFRYQGS